MRIRVRLKWNRDGTGNRARFRAFVVEVGQAGWRISDVGPDRVDPQTYSHSFIMERRSDAHS